MVNSIPQGVNVPILKEGVDGSVHRDELQVHVPCTLPPRNLSKNEELTRYEIIIKIFLKARWNRYYYYYSTLC
jgi:hypothetical protein